MSQGVSGNRNVSFLSAGFSGIPHMRYYCIFLLIVYFIPLLGNSCHKIIIIMDRNRQTKYTAVLNVSLTDIFESMTVIPQQLGAFLFRNCLILYGVCMYMLFFSLQTLTPTRMSFDRLIAMFFPLRYDMIVTHLSVLIIGASWTQEQIQTFFPNRLSFRRASIIIIHFCDHETIFPYTIQVIIMFPDFCIVFSYTCGVLTLFAIKTPTRLSKSNEDVYFSFKISGCILCPTV